METLPENQTQKNSQTTCVTIGVINKLFLKLQTRYGNQWSSQWTDKGLYKLAISEWFDELQHLMVGDLIKGLSNYKGDFPPNLAQFYKACTQKPVGRPTPCYQLWDDSKEKNLLENKGSSSTAKQSMSDIRSFLR